MLPRRSQAFMYSQDKILYDHSSCIGICVRRSLLHTAALCQGYRSRGRVVALPRLAGIAPDWRRYCLTLLLQTGCVNLHPCSQFPRVHASRDGVTSCSLKRKSREGFFARGHEREQFHPMTGVLTSFGLPMQVRLGVNKSHAATTSGLSENSGCPSAVVVIYV